MMFNTTDDKGKNITLYDDNIFTYCPDCGRLVYPNKDQLADVIRYHGFVGTTMYCDACGKRHKKDCGHKSTSENMD